MYLDISVFYLYGKTTFKFYRKQETNKKTFAAYKNQRNLGKLLSICTYIHMYILRSYMLDNSYGEGVSRFRVRYFYYLGFAYYQTQSRQPANDSADKILSLLKTQ